VTGAQEEASRRHVREGFAQGPLATCAVLSLGIAAYFAACYRQHANVVDDAFISFRFAQHLADGHGLVWNVGGPPTEGYTNFLWVLILALARHLGLNLEVVALTVMLIATLGTIAALLLIAIRHLGGVDPLIGAVIALYAADPYTAVHTVSGLETPLALLVLTVATGCVLELLRRASNGLAIGTACVFFLAMLTRPDLGLFVGGLSIALISGWRAVGVRRVLLVLGTAVLLSILYLCWKARYFGYLLPNPFYVKSAPDHVLALAGLRYVLRFFDHLSRHMAPLWIPVLIVLIVGRKSVVPLLADVKRRLGNPGVRAAVLACALPPVLGWSYYVTIIHEVGFASRFSFPTYPFLVLCTGAVVAFSSARQALIPTAAKRIIMLIVGGAIIVRTPWPLSAEPAAFPTDLHAPIADALAATHLGPRVSLHFMGAGLIPYRSEVNHVDPVGLTDNELCGRVPLSRDEYERVLWSRPADTYLGLEPPASVGSATPEEDPVMTSPYLAHLLSDQGPGALTWRRATFGPITMTERREFLHRRMRRLRDEWVWLGEDYSETLWAHLRIRLFVYVRRDSPFRDRLITALRPIADVPPEAVDLKHLEPARASGPPQ
jgi:hypothetical protein